MEAAALRVGARRRARGSGRSRRDAPSEPRLAAHGAQLGVGSRAAAELRARADAPHRAARCGTRAAPARPQEGTGNALSGDELKRTQRTFMRLDNNADGEVDFDEFRQIVAKVTRQRGSAMKSEAWMRSAFEAVDRDTNGQIGFAEFLEAHAQLEATPSVQPEAGGAGAQAAES